MRNIVTRGKVREVIGSILSRYSPKKVAGTLKVSERNLYNWRNEVSEPSAYHLIRLMSEYDEVWNAVQFMAGRQNADSGLSKQDVDLIHQAILLIGDAIPAPHSKAPTQKDSSCRRFSYPHTENIAGFVGKRIISMATT